MSYRIDLDTAARIVADCVCAGDMDSARYWAGKFAALRDDDLTSPELMVWLAGSAERIAALRAT